MADNDVTPIEVAEMFNLAAEEFENAAAHCRVSATHFEMRDVPAGCAHKVAALGHVAKGREILDRISIIHSGKAQLPD